MAVKLKILFSSSVRADILSLLLNSPDEQFYIREIAKLLRKNPSGVKKELDNLEKMGIVNSEKIANLKYFPAKELKDIERRFDQKINCTIMDEDEYRLKKKKGAANLKKISSGKKIALIGKP